MRTAIEGGILAVLFLVFGSLVGIEAQLKRIADLGMETVQELAHLNDRIARYMDWAETWSEKDA